MRYFLSLGSNLGDRAKNLAKAISLLEKQGVKVMQASSLYETEPVDFPDQPWFFNQVIEVETDRKPSDFLNLVKKAESKIGRKTLKTKGPRIIDIDILLAEQVVIQKDELVIPHPRMETRNFVLVPLKEISPETIHPILKVKIEDLWKRSRDKAAVRKIDQ